MGVSPQSSAGRFQVQVSGFGRPVHHRCRCAETRLIVEVDGSQHTEEVDRERTRFLEGEGYVVLRFWNNEVFENLDGVLLTIKAACEARTWREAEEQEGRSALTQPSPAKAGEG